MANSDFPEMFRREGSLWGHPTQVWPRADEKTGHWQRKGSFRASQPPGTSLWKNPDFSVTPGLTEVAPMLATFLSFWSFTIVLITSASDVLSCVIRDRLWGCEGHHALGQTKPVSFKQEIIRLEVETTELSLPCWGSTPP